MEHTSGQSKEVGEDDIDQREPAGEVVCVLGGDSPADGFEKTSRRSHAE